MTAQSPTPTSSTAPTQRHHPLRTILMILFALVLGLGLAFTYMELRPGAADASALTAQPAGAVGGPGVVADDLLDD